MGPPHTSRIARAIPDEFLELQVEVALLAQGRDDTALGGKDALPECGVAQYRSSSLLSIGRASPSVAFASR